MKLKGSSHRIVAFVLAQLSLEGVHRLLISIKSTLISDDYSFELNNRQHYQLGNLFK